MNMEPTPDVMPKQQPAEEQAAIMEAMPAITFIAHDPQCSSMTSSRAACELLRLLPNTNTSLSAPANQSPRTFRPIKDGRELSPEELPVQQVARTGQAIHDYELTLAFEDGDQRVIYGNVVPLLDQAGKPRGAVGSFLDITDRKKAEEALRENEARYRGLFEHRAEGYAYSMPWMPCPRVGALRYVFVRLFQASTPYLRYRTRASACRRRRNADALSRSSPQSAVTMWVLTRETLRHAMGEIVAGKG